MLIADCGKLWQTALRLNQEGKIDEAISTGQQAHALCERLFSKMGADYATSLNFLGLLYRIKGDDAKAEPLWREALQIRKEVLGEKHADYGQSLNNLGALYHAKRDLARAEPLLRRGLAVRKEALGTQHADYGQSLNNLAALYVDMGKKDQAEPLHMEALAVRRKALGSEHPEVAQSLVHLAYLVRARGDYNRAESLLTEAMDIERKVYGPAHPAYAITVRTLAEIKALKRDYVRAETLYREALGILKQATGGRDRDYGLAQMNLALVYQDLGNYEQAEALLKEGLDIVKSAGGEDSAEYSTSLHNLANLLVAKSEFARAESVFENLLAIQRRVQGEAHPDYALALCSFGNLCFGTGNLSRGESLVRQALEIQQKVLGKDHKQCAGSLNILARIYEAMGDYARAEPLCRQAVEIWAGTGDKKHPDYAASLINLGSMYRVRGNLAQAAVSMREATEIYAEVLGDSHPNYAEALTNLAWIYELQGRYDRAEPHAEKVVAIRRKLHGESHPEYAAALNNLAHLHVSQQQFAKAEPLYREAIGIWQKYLAAKHPTLATAQNNLARVYRSQGDRAKAEPLYREAVDICIANLEQAALGQSERQQIAMMANVQYYLDNYLSLAIEAQQFEQPCYERVLQWKRMVAGRQMLSRAGLDDATLRPRLDELSVVAGELSGLALATPVPAQQAEWQRRVSALSNRKERLETELSRDSAAFRAAARKPSLVELQQSLSEQVLVDLVIFDHWRLNSSATDGRVVDPWLVAFVVRSTGAPRMIDLGRVAPIESATDIWRAGFGATRRSAEAGQQLRAMIWEKLEPHLAGAKQVLLSTAGPLNRLPLGVLPGKEPETYLIEDVSIAVIAAPLGLPDLLKNSDATSNRSATVLAVGDIDYELSSDTTGVNSSSAPAPMSNLRAEPLPGAKSEIEAVARLYRQRFGDSGLTTLERGKATEAAFRREASRHKCLHLATHGFFAPPGIRSILSRSAHDQAENRGGFSSRQTLAGYHPNLLSGLVLAGANQRQSSGDDGILTAEEVQSLDLRLVELVVLSACETGLGEQAGGEGLLGLQRAFQVAGARTVVASAWKVHDLATRDLMERFYSNLFVKKMGKLESLRDAQLWMLRERGIGGLVTATLDESAVDQKVRRLPPYFWGAFVLSGDWR
jgi:CHAT domain-containing protein/tetratricopeptide (TPR) repeat protein